MASNQKITYPHFYHNQVLKSSTLNGYFEFMDLQTRLSRVHLVGSGIVDGLAFSVKDGALVLSPGVAINKDGWLVEVRDETKYRYVTEVGFSDEDFVSDNLEALVSLGGSRIKKICFQTEDDVRQFDNRLPEPISSLNMNNYVVALVFGKRSEYSSRCSQGSCDLNTTDQLLEVWPVLIEIGDVRSLFQRIAPMKFCVSPQKEPCISCFHGSVDSYNEQVYASARSWVSEITAVMSRLTEHLQLISDTVWNGWLPYDSLMARFADARKQIQDLLAVKSVPDYYISFFGDMAKALNEFIDAYNAFALKYEAIPTRTLSDALVYLGCREENVGGGDAIYRSLFRSARTNEARRDGNLLGRMLERVCILSECFIKDESDSRLSRSPFRVMKVRTGGRLSYKPAPFYYDSSNHGFFDGWNPEKLPMKEYGYLTGSASMNEEGWSFYPEAYQGKELSVVKGELTSLNQSLRLSMDVVEAALNGGTSLKKKEAELLRGIFDLFAGKKDSKFMDDVKKECHGVAYKLADLLDLSYDARLLDALQAGRSFTEEESSAFKEICELESIDADALKELAQAFLNAKGSVSESATKELAAALTDFVSAWKGSFISVDKGISLDEIGKTVPLAPVCRGCRVFLVTKPGKTAKAEHVVVSYGVFYRMHEETGIKVPDKVKPVFRMRSNAKVTGEYAVEFPDTVCPFGDNGKWFMVGNEISFIPYVYNGSAPAMYETSGSSIECQIADPGILVQSRIDILEKKYPSLALQMVGNGRTLVTIKIKDADNELLNSRSFYVEVDNPAWKVVPVSGISIFPTSYDVAVGQKLKLVPEVKPKDATDKSLAWSSDNSLVASVKDGEVTMLREGSAKITVVSVSNKDKKETVTVNVFSYLFRMKTVTKGDGDYLCNIPETVRPYGDGGKWDNSGEQVTILPYKFNGKETKLLNTTKSNLFCEVSDDSILQPSIVSTKNSGASVVLKMLGKNGRATVTLKLTKSSGEVDFAQTFTMEVSNSGWQKIQVRKVDVTPQKLDMYMNQTSKLVAIVTPTDASDGTVTWRSSDTSIATVDSTTGEVTAVKEGSVQITATSEGGKNSSAEVKVSSILFNFRTKEKQANGIFSATFPDTVKPNGDDGRWAFSGNYLRMYVKAYDGMTESDLIIDKSLVHVQIQDLTVLSHKVEEMSNGSPYVEIHLLKKGKSNIKISIKDPNKTGKVIYQRTFTVDGTV